MNPIETFWIWAVMKRHQMMTWTTAVFERLLLLKMNMNWTTATFARFLSGFF